SHGLLHWAELGVPSGVAALVIAIEPAIVALLLPVLKLGPPPRLDIDARERAIAAGHLPSRDVLEIGPRTHRPKAHSVPTMRARGKSREAMASLTGVPSRSSR